MIQQRNALGQIAPCGPPKCHPEKPYGAKGLCRQCYQHKKYVENQEYRKAYMRKWLRENPGYVKQKNRDRYLGRSTEWREKERIRLKKYHDEVRRKAMERLGGKCSRCGFSDWRALQFDHVKGGGRKLRDKRGYNLAAQILRGRHPEGKFQLLCANCNWIKRWENGELGRTKFSHRIPS
jgi:hypothetical protein